MVVNILKSILENLRDNLSFSKCYVILMTNGKKVKWLTHTVSSLIVLLRGNIWSGKQKYTHGKAILILLIRELCNQHANLPLITKLCCMIKHKSSKDMSLNPKHKYLNGTWSCTWLLWPFHLSMNPHAGWNTDIVETTWNANRKQLLQWNFIGKVFVLKCEF